MHNGLLGLNQSSADHQRYTSGQLNIVDETDLWRTKAIGNGGALPDIGINACDRLLRAFQGKSYNTSIKQIYPFVGNAKAMVVPLRDSLGGGLLTPAFSNDYAIRLGLKGGVVGQFFTGVFASQLNPGTSNGGLGFYDPGIAAALAGGAVEPIASRNTANSNIHGLDLRSAARRFWWGGATGLLTVAGTAINNAFYYGERSSATLRTLYENGVSIGTDVDSETPTGLADRQIQIMGEQGDGIWNGIGGLAIMTDGTLGSTNAADLYATILSEFITPLSRVG